MARRHSRRRARRGRRCRIRFDGAGACGRGRGDAKIGLGVLERLAEVAVIAGASSNIIDRFWYGGVVDFILLEYEQWSWPLFNVADIVIVGGIIVMVFNSFWPDRKKLL